MKLSRAGLALVKEFEGCHRAIGGGNFKAYLDPVGVLTIGYGHTSHHHPKIDHNTIWTQEQCDAALAHDMALFEDAVERQVQVDLNQHQFDALVSFTFNVGEGALARSTLLRKLNAGDYRAASFEFAKWNRAGGRVLLGLTRRRAAEAKHFRGK